MKLDEYLETVSEQIRYTKIRSTVTEELKNHITDQAEAYEACGAFPEEAMERAIREMGDPVATGVSLDRIHRPQMHWGIVLSIAIISILNIGMFLLADSISSNTYPWQRQALFVILGFALMLVVYRLDYSILEQIGTKCAVTFLLAIILAFIFAGSSANGVYRWISLGKISFSVSEMMLLYIPIFASALYSFRGQGYIVFAKILPLILIPTIFLSAVPALSYSVILFTSLFCIVTLAVWKNWFQIHRKSVLIICCLIVVLTPLLLLSYVYFFGETYQVARISQMFSAADSQDYIMRMAKSMRENSAFFGSSHASLEYFVNGPTTDFLSDLVIASMCSIYGIFLTVAIITGLLFILLKALHISFSQKNQLGMIIGSSCGIVFLIKTAVGILVNLQIIPYIAINIPFLSYGGSGIIVSYILLGFILSVYRYKNILPAKTNNQKRKQLKITWE